jgi:autotransporter-associated beta strand protein
VVANAAAVVLEGAGLTVVNPITVVGTGLSNGGALVNTGGSNTLTGQVTLGGNTLFNVASNLTIQQGIKEAAVSGLSLGGAGRLILSGANLYTGGTTVAVGSTLQVGDGKTGTILGNILDNGAVEFNYGGSITGITDTIIEKIGFIGSYMFPYDQCDGALDLQEGGPLRCYSDNLFASFQPHYIGACDYVGIDISDSYIEMANERIENYLSHKEKHDKEMAKHVITGVTYKERKRLKAEKAAAEEQKKSEN